MYKIVFEKRAAKSLSSLSVTLSRKIALSLKDLSTNPRQKGCKKLLGTFKDYWRIRIGDYRVVYEIDDEEMIVRVYRIMHRKEVYK